tara:strand:+ start:2568 stop:3056 length:489 start_codon:yes stop_codon:yes gene_type:complete
MIILGNTDGCENEVKNISEATPSIVKMKNVAMCTFITVANTLELNDYFTSFNRNFFLFELNPLVSCYNINNMNIYARLFSEIENRDDLEMEEFSGRLNEELNYKNGHSDSNQESDEPETIIDYFKELSNSDKEEFINEILEKGVKNMTKDDMKILDVFSNDK